MKVKDLIPMVFSEHPIGTLPTRKPYDFAIDLNPDFKPVIQKPFCLDQKQNEAVRTFIQENLNKGFIRPFHSSQTSALFFVSKEDSTWYKTIIILTPRLYIMDIHFLV